MTNVILSFNVDLLSLSDQNIVYKMVKAQSFEQKNLRPSRHGWLYGIYKAAKNGSFAGQRVFKNAKLLFFGKKFNEALAEQVSYTQANLAC